MAAEPHSACTLKLRGELTVSTIAKAHKKLVSAWAGAHDIGVDLNGVKEADLTLVQLIQSARLSAQRDGKTIHLIQPIPSALLSELERGGFLDTADQFWTSAG
jgi:ABC-type transporter Mla MlaB component